MSAKRKIQPSKDEVSGSQELRKKRKDFIQMLTDFMDDIYGELDILQEEVINIQEQNQLNVKELEDVRSQLDQAEQQNNQLSQKLITAKQQLDQQKQNFESELSELHQANDDKKRMFESKLAESHEKNLNLQEEIEASTHSYTSLNQENLQLSDQLDQAIQEKIAATTAEANLLNDVEVIKSQLEKLEEENQSLSEKLKKTETQVRSIRQKKIWERKKLDKARKVAEAQCDDLRKELSQFEERIHSLEFEHDALRSDKEVLRIEYEKFEEKARREQDHAQWEIMVQLSDYLSKLSALAGKEPQEVKGLNIESVYKDLLDWLTDSIGEKPKPFPMSKECDVDGTLWLDADQQNLELLTEMYDWSNERPFENLPSGERMIPFRVMRRGWRVKDGVLMRARVASIDIE